MATGINTGNITVGKPNQGGCVYWAPKGTTLPTDASTALAATYVSLGDISEDGFTEKTDLSSNDFNDWSGNTVLTVAKGKKRTWGLTFIEALNANVLKLVYGKANVEVDPTTSALKSVTMTGEDVDEGILVIEELYGANSDVKCRTVIDRAKIDSYDDVPHTMGDLLAYGMEFTGLDNDGEVGHKYYATVA